MSGLGYRDFANDEPFLYDLMIGQPIPDISQPDRQVARDGVWLRLTARGLVQAIECGVLEGPVDEIGHALWAIVHGVVELRRNGFVAAPDEDRRLIRFAHGLFSAYAGPAFDSAGPQLLDRFT